jgi:hypothetical protein
VQTRLLVARRLSPPSEKLARTSDTQPEARHGSCCRWQRTVEQEQEERTQFGSKSAAGGFKCRVISKCKFNLPSFHGGRYGALARSIDYANAGASSGFIATVHVRCHFLAALERLCGERSWCRPRLCSTQICRQQRHTGRACYR